MDIIFNLGSDKQMICLLKNSILRQNLLFKSTFLIANSLDQHIERNKAILSSQIISTIKQSPINQYRNSKPYPSLRQTILNNIQTYQIDVPHQPEQQKITSAVRYALKKYFTDGVWVPYSMCSQQTFTQTVVSYQTIKSNQEQVEAYIDQTKPNLTQIQFRKLRFCPTYFITGQVFRYIFEDVQYRYLTGQQGIGKTYSLILYTLLSEIIFRYRHKYCKNSKMSQLSPKINPNIPKALYWCVNMSEQTKVQTLLANIIKTHFYEIKYINKIIKDITKSRNQIDTIRQVMQDHFRIKTILLYDQINELAAVLRDDYNLKLKIIQFWMKKIREIRKRKQTKASKNLQQILNDQLSGLTLPTEQERIQDIIELNDPETIMNLHFSLGISLPKQIKKQMKDISKRYQIYCQYSNMLREIILRWQFKNLIYLSSMDIEAYFLDQLNLLGFTKQSKIQDHQRKIYYPTRFDGAIPIADTLELVIFNLENKWKKSGYKISEDNVILLLQKIKEQLFIHIRNEQFGLFSPICIKQVIDKQPQVELVNILISQQKGKFSKVILDLMKKIQYESEKQISNQLEQFLDKQLPVKDHQQLKLKLIAQLQSQSYEIIKNYQNQNYLQTFNLEQKINRDMIEQPVLQIQLKHMDYEHDILQEMTHFMPYQLFTYNNYRLRCFINPYTLLKILTKQKKRIQKQIESPN